MPFKFANQTFLERALSWFWPLQKTLKKTAKLISEKLSCNAIRVATAGILNPYASILGTIKLVK